MEDKFENREKERFFEIEKRSLIESEEVFNKLKSFLENEGEFLGEKNLKSFLYRDPEHLRIRLTEGEDEAVITKKTGTYEDQAREEVNLKIKTDELSEFIEHKIKEGFKECSEVNTERFIFLYNGVKVEMNIIDHLGLIVEVEATTKDEGEVDELKKKVAETLKKLNIREFEAKDYQAMINGMYEKTLKPVDGHKFSF